MNVKVNDIPISRYQFKILKYLNHFDIDIELFPNSKYFDINYINRYLDKDINIIKFITDDDNIEKLKDEFLDALEDKGINVDLMRNTSINEIFTGKKEDKDIALQNITELVDNFKVFTEQDLKQEILKSITLLTQKSTEYLLKELDNNSISTSQAKEILALIYNYTKKN